MDEILSFDDNLGKDMQIYGSTFLSRHFFFYVLSRFFYSFFYPLFYTVKLELILPVDNINIVMPTQDSALNENNFIVWNSVTDMDISEYANTHEYLIGNYLTDGMMPHNQFCSDSSHVNNIYNLFSFVK